MISVYTSIILFFILACQIIFISLSNLGLQLYVIMKLLLFNAFIQIIIFCLKKIVKEVMAKREKTKLTTPKKPTKSASTQCSNRIEYFTINKALLSTKILKEEITNLKKDG